MATPSDMTATLLVTEAYKLVGTSSPTTAEITRGEDYFLRGVLNDIFTDSGGQSHNRLKSLQAFSAQPSVVGKNKYAFPSDFDEEITISILSGTFTGTASSGGSNTITLTGSPTVENVEGNYIFISGGTNVNDIRQCIDYNVGTKEAIVDSNWTEDTTDDSEYVVVDTVTELAGDSLLDTGGLGGSDFVTSSPTSFVNISERENEYMLFNKAFDAATYGIYLRYYVDPNALDLSSALMTKLYNKWMQTLIYGVAKQIALSEDDNKSVVLDAEYKRMLKALLLKEVPFKWTQKRRDLGVMPTQNEKREEN